MTPIIDRAAVERHVSEQMDNSGDVSPDPIVVTRELVEALAEQFKGMEGVLWETRHGKLVRPGYNPAGIALCRSWLEKELAVSVLNDGIVERDKTIAELREALRPIAEKLQDSHLGDTCPVAACPEKIGKTALLLGDLRRAKAVHIRLANRERTGAK